MSAVFCWIFMVLFTALICVLVLIFGALNDLTSTFREIAYYSQSIRDELRKRNEGEGL